MTVSLIWATHSADALIARMARVSAPGNEDKPAERLIEFMWRNGHVSPFGMVNVCMEFYSTRDIGRQMLRHDLEPQEFSQRYADVGKLDGPIIREARLAHPTDRQASLPCEDDDLVVEWANRQQAVWNHAVAHYRWALSRGLAKECARVVLPEGNTPTRMYFNGTLRNWLFYTKSRIGHGTQKEHETIARAVREVLRGVAPISVAAFEAAYGEAA